MSRILIIDDDKDFNALLKDIYEQSGYNVTAETSPEAGFRIFCQESFDMVVTDQRMPGLTGEQLIRKMREVRTDVPIVMVSAFLDNDTIRSLIREGVGGVFLKPLNVMSLIKRTAALIESHKQMKTPQSDIRDEVPMKDPRLGFPFTCLPCQCEPSIAFAKRLHDLRNFKSNLILIAPKGVEVEAVIKDFSAFDTGEKDAFETLNANDFDAVEVIHQIDEAMRIKVTRITYIVLHPQNLKPKDRQSLISLARREGLFGHVEIPVRFIFITHRDLDSLFDTGVISDDLYMFMGTTEVRIPQLAEIGEDVPFLVMRYLKEESQKRNNRRPPRIDARTRAILREKSWTGNHAQLRSFCAELAGLGRDEITREDIDRIERQIELTGSQGSGQIRIKDELRKSRQDALVAALTLCAGNTEKAALVLDIEKPFIEALVRTEEGARP